MNKKIVGITIITTTVIGLGIYFSLNQERSLVSQKVGNFEECVRAGYPVMENYLRKCQTPDGKIFIEEIDQNPLPLPGPITISGEIICLPKIGQGPQTMECAIGLKGTDSQYYGLRNLFDHDPEHKFSAGGLQVEISGTFSPEEIKGPDGNKYDVIGIINIISIKELVLPMPLPVINNCLVTGCSGEICSNEEVFSACIFRPESICFKTAKCERQRDNQCGWTMTDELTDCLFKNREKIY